MSPQEVLESLFLQLNKEYGEGEEVDVSLQGGMFSAVHIRGMNGFLGISKSKGSYFHFYVWEELSASFYPHVLFRLSVRRFASYINSNKCIESICVETKEDAQFYNSYTVDSPLYEFIEEIVRPRFHALQKKLSSIAERTYAPQ